MKKEITALRQIGGYAVKMLTMPRGTKFEQYGQPVNRFAYTWATSKFLWRATFPGRNGLRRRFKMSQIGNRMESARWHFFGYNPVGAKLLDAADRLHDKYPESGIVCKLWTFCLPF